MSISSIFLAKILFSLAGLGFVWLFYFLRKKQIGKKVLLAILIPVTIFASWGFFNFDKNIVDVGYWDIYHYYINAKYFDELGYFEIYRSSLLANEDNGGHFKNVKKVRNLHTQIHGSREINEADEKFLREQFSPERWKQFQSDVDFFFAKLNPKVLTDRGYNASPAWNKTGSLITNALPLENPATIPILFSLDILIFAIIVGVIAAVFGIVPALFFIFLLGVNPLAMRPLQFAFLRLDWVLGIVASIAFWQKKRFVASGTALAFAAFLRVFPVILLTGIILRAGFDFWKKKKLSLDFQKFFVGFALAAAALFFYGSLDRTNNFDFSRWIEFAEKIIVHAQASSNQRSGLSYLVPNSVEFLRIPLGLFVCGLFAFAIRRTPKKNLIPLGLLLIPIFSAPASYYFCSIAILILAFVDLSKKQNAFALSFIFVAFILQSLDTIHENVNHNSDTSYFWSMLYFILTLAILLVVKNSSRKIKSLPE